MYKTLKLLPNQLLTKPSLFNGYPILPGQRMSISANPFGPSLRIFPKYDHFPYVSQLPSWQSHRNFLPTLLPQPPNCVFYLCPPIVVFSKIAARVILLKQVRSHLFSKPSSELSISVYMPVFFQWPRRPCIFQLLYFLLSLCFSLLFLGHPPASGLFHVLPRIFFICTAYSLTSFRYLLK